MKVGSSIMSTMIYQISSGKINKDQVGIHTTKQKKRDGYKLSMWNMIRVPFNFFNLT